MGMFDYINCRAPLPDGWQPADRALQTKDFDCDMVCHEITADGRLMLCRVTDRRFEPDPALAHKDGILKYRGALKLDTEIVETAHHGYVNFYGEDTDGQWHEYSAKFTDGRLVSIHLILDEAE